MAEQRTEVSEAQPPRGDDEGERDAQSGLPGYGQAPEGIRTNHLRGGPPLLHPESRLVDAERSERGPEEAAFEEDGSYEAPVMGGPPY